MLYAIHKLCLLRPVLSRHIEHLVRDKCFLFSSSCSLVIVTKAFPLAPRCYEVAAKTVAWRYFYSRLAIQRLNVPIRHLEIIEFGAISLPIDVSSPRMVVTFGSQHRQHPWHREKSCGKIYCIGYCHLEIRWTLDQLNDIHQSWWNWWDWRTHLWHRNLRSHKVECVGYHNDIRKIAAIDWPSNGLSVVYEPSIRLDASASRITIFYLSVNLNK